VNAPDAIVPVDSPVERVVGEPPFWWGANFCNGFRAIFKI
jgi:hypothetical protein